LVFLIYSDMLKGLFAACLLVATAVVNRLPTSPVDGRIGCVQGLPTTKWLLAGAERPPSIARPLTSQLAPADSVRKKASLTVKVFAEKISQPLYKAVVVIQSRATGKSERFTVLNGRLERTFTTPDEIVVEVMADGYKSVKFPMTIAVSPQGNRYEFDTELDPVPIVLTVMAVDNRTKQLIRDAHFTISGKTGKTTLLLTTDSTTGLAKTNLPGRGVYQLSSSATGYGNFTKSIKLDSVQSEARVMLTAEPLPDVSKVQALPEAVVTSAMSSSVATIAAKPVGSGPLRTPNLRIPAVTNAALVLPETGKSVPLSNVYFDQSSPVLRPESNPELNQLYDMLVRNPSTRIEIRGHTDNQGDFDANVQLSRDRCQAVVAYLVSKGIRKDRLKGVGRGPIDPIAPNNNEENRKKNRRVEFIPF
jgi:OOP family OmpA-OmpF porin